MKYIKTTRLNSGFSQSTRKTTPVKKDSKSSITIKSLILISTFTLLFGAVFCLFYYNTTFEYLQLDRFSSTWGKAITYLGFVLLTFNVGFLIYMFILYLNYKETAPLDNKDLPRATVIVPAYNEGKLVYKTLKSLVNSDYPHEKLQIISIDDGSKDDTWNWMQKAKAEFGERVSIYQQPKNKGKRHALYRGFKIGKGDVFVTVDSDSIVKSDTLKYMVSPFMANPSCGAVAGNVRVLNKEDGLIPRMLNVSFAFSFEFIRSAQSKLGSVFCTPGALSAYRREAVMNCLPDWINQTFMGRPSTIGEDRAMTNMILKQGYKVFFQKSAFVYTNIPERYKTLHKMFTRWQRSNVRETIAMSKFAFGSFREGSKFGTRTLLLYQWSRLLLAIPMMILMLAMIIFYPILFLNGTLVGILIFASIQALFYAKKHDLSDSFWAYPYSLFYAFTLFWITPYAILTAHHTGWLTRELSQKVKAKAS